MSTPADFLEVSETPVPIVRPAGEGKAVGVLGHTSLFKVLPDETGGAYAILEQTIPAGHGPPLHLHRHETEIFYILEGEFEIRVGEETIRVAPGALAVGPRGIPHTFRNSGTTEGRLLLTVLPGRFAHYFIEVDHIPDSNRESIKALCAKYDVDILE